VSSATYNADNQLTNWAGTTLTYDANGNLTADGTSTYTWNARGELTTIAAGSTTTAAYGYDPTGRRTAKTISGATTGFAYNGSTAIQEKTGSTVSANSIVGGTDQILSRTDSAGARTYLTDGLDSTLALVDASGVIKTSYAYTPYGATTASGAASTNPVQYAGRENDANGLYYYRARYYNPTYGRFISEDPLGLAAGSNLYRYAADDPVDLNDPSGMILHPVGGMIYRPRVCATQRGATYDPESLRSWHADPESSSIHGDEQARGAQGRNPCRSRRFACQRDNRRVPRLRENRRVQVVVE
jgi:RHS repeat-associated protein